jgi:hypothetical protein
MGASSSRTAGVARQIKLLAELRDDSPHHLRYGHILRSFAFKGKSDFSQSIYELNIWIVRRADGQTDGRFSRERHRSASARALCTRNEPMGKDNDWVEEAHAIFGQLEAYAPDELKSKLEALFRRPEVRKALEEGAFDGNDTRH